jgi:hypothetical protein
MATIKSFTSLEQSKKLAEILPLESADMYWDNSDTGGRSYTIHIGKSIAIERNFLSYKLGGQICAWSLEALLSVLPSATLDSSNNHYYMLGCMERFTEWHDNAVDACVAMIEKLHKLKML